MVGDSHDFCLARMPGIPTTLLHGLGFDLSSFSLLTRLSLECSMRAMSAPTSVFIASAIFRLILSTVCLKNDNVSGSVPASLVSLRPGSLVLGSFMAV